MTKCWSEPLHGPPCEFIYFVRTLGSSQGHHRSWAQTGRGGVHGVAPWRIMFNDTPPDVSLPDGFRPGVVPQPRVEWFIQMFPRDWSCCSGLEMTDNSEGFSLGGLSSNGGKIFRSIRSRMTNSEIKCGVSISSVHLSSCDLTRRMKHLLNLFRVYPGIIPGVRLSKSPKRVFRKGEAEPGMWLGEPSVCQMSSRCMDSSNRLSVKEKLYLLRIELLVMACSNQGTLMSGKGRIRAPATPIYWQSHNW